MIRVVAAILVALGFAVPSCWASNSRQIAAMVVFEGISVEQMIEWDIPEYRSLVAAGAVGLMNNKTPTAQTLQNNAVTFSAGTRATAQNYACSGFNFNELVERERAHVLLERNTGNTAPEGSVVQISLASIERLNSEQRYQVTPGLLGRMLQDACVDTVVLGNSDSASKRSRIAVTIAMNNKGWVTCGDVGEKTLIPDESRPCGVRSNYEYFLDYVSRLSRGRHFVVIEAGDLGRANAVETDLSPEQHEHFKRLAAQDTCRFACDLDKALRESTGDYLLIVVSAAPCATDYASGNRLTPVVITGSNVDPGLLTSASTRRDGLITNLDIAPSVLRRFRIKPDSSMIGSAINTVRSEHPLESLAAMNSRMVTTFNARVPVLIGYVVVVAGCTMLAVLAAILLKSPSNMLAVFVTRRKFVEVLMVAVMVAPTAFLVAPGLGILGKGPTAAFLALSSLATAYLLRRWMADARLVFAAVGAIVVAPLCADLLMHGRLLRMSILGYDSIAGIRFYGIGNESAGVLIGGTLLGVYSLLDYAGKVRRLHIALAAVLCVAVVVLIGSPSNGTNFGGMLTALAAFGFALAKTRGSGSWKKAALWTALAGIGLLALLMAANVLVDPANQSHIGRALSVVGEGDTGSFADTAIRKWAMNLALIKRSVWTYALASLGIGLAVLFWRAMDNIRSALSCRRLMNAGLAGIVVTCVVGFAVNDSGISLAATAMPYLAIPLMFIVQADQSKA